MWKGKPNYWRGVARKRIDFPCCCVLIRVRAAPAVGECLEWRRWRGLLATEQRGGPVWYIHNGLLPGMYIRDQSRHKHLYGFRKSSSTARQIQKHEVWRRRTLHIIPPADCWPCLVGHLWGLQGSGSTSTTWPSPAQCLHSIVDCFVDTILQWPKQSPNWRHSYCDRSASPMALEKACILQCSLCLLLDSASLWMQKGPSISTHPWTLYSG